MAHHEKNIGKEKFSPEWDALRRRKLFLVGYRCQQCHDKRPLHVEQVGESRERGTIFL